MRICRACAAWHSFLYQPLGALSFSVYVAKLSHWLRGSFTMSEVAHLGATQPVHLRDRVDRRDCAPQTARPCTPAAIAIGLADQSSALDLFERVATIRSIISGRIVFTTSFGLEDQAIAHVIFSQL